MRSKTGLMFLLCLVQALLLADLISAYTYGHVTNVYAATESMMNNPNCNIKNRWVYRKPEYKMRCYQCGEHGNTYIVISKDSILLGAADTDTCHGDEIALSIDVVSKKRLTDGTDYCIQYGFTSGLCVRMKYKYKLVNGAITAERAPRCYERDKFQLNKTLFKPQYYNGWERVETFDS